MSIDKFKVGVFSHSPDNNFISQSVDVEHFITLILQMPTPIFAVVDGARYGDLPQQLENEGLSGQSLFLEHADAEIEKAGGWMVPIRGYDDLIRLIDISGEIDTMIFWSCPQGENTLHRHLRSINLVKIPSDAHSPVARSPEIDESDSPQTATSSEHTVLFRHYDPQVLAAVLPLLDAEQFARVFGPAIYIMMFTPEHGGVRSVCRPEQLPISPRGPLRLNKKQMQELEQLRQDVSRVKILQFLRRNDKKIQNPWTTIP